MTALKMDALSTWMMLLLTSGLLGNTAVSGADWSYEGSNGPEFWNKSYPICGDDSQSPINIYEGDVTVPGNLPPFSFSDYNTAPQTMTLKNNGHTAVVNLGGGKMPTIRDGGLPNVFSAAQFHYHWGDDSTRGSEHLLSSHAYPMELHIVHYNTKYDNISMAVDQADGLAVLGFMFEVSESDNTEYTELTNQLQQVQAKDATVALTPQSLDSLMTNNNLDKYYRYSGSLTTPACYESVTWTVFKETIKISESQLEKFRSIQDEQGSPVVDNYRPVQPHNGREIQASYKPDIHWGYMDNGAETWSHYYQACGGQSQSPISIPSGSSYQAITAFQYRNYDSTNVSLKILNNGHTVQVNYNSGDLSINGGGLSETYQTAQFHLHWGAIDSRGSEHKVDNQAFPAELHIVHYKSSLKTLGGAVTAPEGLAVLGFFFEVTDTDNEALAPLISALPGVINPATEKPMQAFSLESILPATRDNFYRYSGSLTTPACYESVIWAVFTDKIPISQSQLNAFRALRSSETNSAGAYMDMVDNYRPVQPINSRAVVRNFDSASPKWTYEGSSGVKVEDWGSAFPACANTPGVSSQSPIDLINTQIKYEQISAITLSGYDTPTTLMLSNNGHTIVATVKSGVPRISGGGFSDTYRAAQFHFHWGASDAQGSEHFINSRAYPMEVHIVHYGERFRSLGQAVSQPNGLAVLGFMFEIVEEDNPQMNVIVNNLDQVKNPNTEFMLPTSLILRTMLPSSLGDFYRYSGSLTTPGCFESVTWTVFRDSIKISQRQLAKFREVLSSDKDAANMYTPLVNNYRPPQPVNGRLVRANFKVSLDSAAGVKASLLICSVGVLLAFFVGAH